LKGNLHRPTIQVEKVNSHSASCGKTVLTTFGCFCLQEREYFCSPHSFPDKKEKRHILNLTKKEEIKTCRTLKK